MRGSWSDRAVAFRGSCGLGEAQDKAASRYHFVLSAADSAGIVRRAPAIEIPNFSSQREGQLMFPGVKCSEEHGEEEDESANGGCHKVHMGSRVRSKFPPRRN